MVYIFQVIGTIGGKEIYSISSCVDLFNMTLIILFRNTFIVVNTVRYIEPTTNVYLLIFFTLCRYIL